jgi:hypothetical protein
MKRRFGRSCGTALSLAVILLAVVAAAITALTVAFAAEARRTRSAVIGPQQRQLLLAATFLAADELNAHGTQPRQLALATPLPSATLTLTVSPPADTATATLTVLCDYRGTQASETLTYEQKNGAWRLAGATLRQNP